MEYEVVNQKLKELLEAHGLECEENEDWIIPNGTFPLISMTWYPKPEQGSGVLQIDVQLDQETSMHECFAGIGSGNEGLNDGFHNFCVNSLHVILAALWGINDPEQVETEEWTIGGEDYSVYVGPFGTKGSNGVHPGIPEDAFSTIESAIKAINLNGQCIWFRNYYCNLNPESKVYESLLNNEVWAAGEKALKSISWHPSDNFYSVRNFVIAIKHTE